MSKLKAKQLDKVLLQFFWDLVSIDESARIKTSAELIRYIDGKQKEWIDSKNQLGDYCPQLEYSTNRLIKGLTSPREGARQGFALALTEVRLHNDLII
jgi:DNA polymerase phi